MMKIINRGEFLYINSKIVIKKMCKFVFNFNFFIQQKNLVELQKLICLYKEENN
jgi:hypothetical protein